MTSKKIRSPVFTRDLIQKADGNKKGHGIVAPVAVI
jgi:hypothetical protein